MQHIETTVEAAPRAGRREWIGLAVLALPCLLYSMDLTVLHLAVPSLTADLAPSSVQLLWIIDIYGFLVAGSLITMGTLGDRIGRRRLLLVGAAFFGGASVLAAFSRSAETLIASRALLGVAGATVAPSTLSLIRNMFMDAGQRSFAIGVWISAFSLGGIVGPFVGGALLEFFWWGSVFLIAVPVMALLLVAGPQLLPEYRDPHAGRLDLASAALSVSAVLGVIYGFKEIAQDGVSAVPLLAVSGGAVLGALFVRRQLALDDPLIDVRLFSKPAFTASVATYGLTILVLFGSFLFLPQYLQLVLGLSPLEAGLWSVPSSVAFLAAAMATPALARGRRPAPVMALGLLFAALGYVVILRLDGSSDFTAYALATTALSVGAAPVFTLTNDLIIGSAPPERAGAAAGISETSAELGGALGISLFGSIGVWVYRRTLEEGRLPGAPSDALTAALDTLGGALAAAAELPSEVAAPLVDAARAAFLAGVRVCAVIAMLGALALAAFVVARLRHVPGAPEPGASAPTERRRDRRSGGRGPRGEHR
jgi:DHA2 family multidrug resistance protein-like MFS transporter